MTATHRALDDPATLARAARIVRTAMTRRRDRRREERLDDIVWLSQLRLINREDTDTAWRR